jgi:hypothetical protein
MAFGKDCCKGCPGWALLAGPVAFALVFFTWFSPGRSEDAQDKKEREKLREKVARQQVKLLTQAAAIYELNSGRRPKKLSDLAKVQPGGGKAIIKASALKDPWGKPFQYDPKGPKNGGDKVDVWTVTPGGKTIGNWQAKKKKK